MARTDAEEFGKHIALSAAIVCCRAEFVAKSCLKKFLSKAAGTKVPKRAVKIPIQFKTEITKEPYS